MRGKAVQGNNRLSDGRAVRALEGMYSQTDMFSLKGRIPAHESIMSVRELDDAINVSGAHSSIKVNGAWRSDRYGVYARGFETELDKPVGAKVVWFEEYSVHYTFEVPDVRHPTDKSKGLRQATGMLDFALDKLQYNEGRLTVSVAPDFNPETDVVVRDIMRPKGWALVDADGYPMRKDPSHEGEPAARYSFVNHSNEFRENATGWHGSIARFLDYYFNVDTFKTVVGAYFGWSKTGVAVVARDIKVAPGDSASEMTFEALSPLLR